MKLVKYGIRNRCRCESAGMTTRRDSCHIIVSALTGVIEDDKIGGFGHFMGGYHLSPMDVLSRIRTITTRFTIEQVFNWIGRSELEIKIEQIIQVKME